jgi:hypothetical protein
MLDILPDDRAERSRFGICDNLSANAPATLEDAVDDCLAHGSPTFYFLLAFFRVHVFGFSPNESFVRFYLAPELSKCAGSHGFSNPVEHKPCGFLSYTQSPAQLVRGNPVFAVGNYPDRDKPFIETERRIFKNRPNFIGELFATIFASQHVAGGNFSNSLRFTVRASDSVRPLDFFHVGMADVQIGKIADGLNQSLGEIFHDEFLKGWPRGSSASGRVDGPDGQRVQLENFNPAR